MGGACSTYGERKSLYSVLVGRPEGKRPLGRPKRRWKDNIRMDPLQVVCGAMDWIYLAEDRDRWGKIGRKLLFHPVGLGAPEIIKCFKLKLLPAYRCSIGLDDYLISSPLFRIM
jgi:hypothetical protein